MPCFKLFFALGVLSWLAACTTAPLLPPATLPIPSLASATSPVKTPQTAALASILGTASVATDNVLPGPETGTPHPARLAGEPPREYQRGGASWYGPGFHGRRTASGERYDMHDFTAAHRTLPFGTLVQVKSLVNGREVLVRITDRGPFIAGRIIDLSRAAAADLGLLNVGFKQVVLMLPEAIPQAVGLPLPGKSVGQARRRGSKVR